MLPLTSPPDTDLADAGWTRRFTTDVARAQEHRETYEQLGYETKLVPLAPSSFGADCGPCASATAQVEIHTRRPEDQTPEPDLEKGKSP